MNLENRPKVIVAIAAVAAVLMISSYIFVLSSDAEGYDGPVDALGNRTSFDGVPNSIVTTAPSITESVFALGYGDKVVAVSDNCDYPNEIVQKVSNGDVKTVASYSGPSVELIMEENADVIFMYNTAAGINAYNQLRDAKEPAVMLYDELSIVHIYNNFIIISTVMNDQEAANQLTQSMIQSFNSIAAFSSDGNNPNVQVNLGYDWERLWGSGVYVAGQNTFANDIITFSNGTNVIPVSGWKPITNEWLGDDPVLPDIILVMASTGTDVDQAYYDDMMNWLENDDLWKHTPAVQNGEVYVFYDRAASIMQRPSTGLVDAAKLTTMYVQQDLFDDFTAPKFIGDDYADLFEGHW